MRTPILLAALATPGSALACGGFFCDSTPINQAMEKIVFAVDETEAKVEAHVEITYEGSAASFAWIVPTPTVPELFLSTETLFDVLVEHTEPTFQTSSRIDGDCAAEDAEPNDTDMDADIDSDWGSADTADSFGPPPPLQVEVISEQQVGPYETAILLAESETDLLLWLNRNDYQVPFGTSPALAPYVASGAYFVALRLANDKDTGDLAPLGMRYDGTVPMIPLQLTSIAATPDMRLDTFVFGAHRAVPSNYLHVRINEAAIDWLAGGDNYRDVVTMAADEAGGHAFATDFSGPAASLTGTILPGGDLDVSRLVPFIDPIAFVAEMDAMGFPPTQAVYDQLTDALPLPAELAAHGVTQAEFIACLGCFPSAVAAIDFDPVALADALETFVVAPMRHAESLFADHPTLTRLSSSVSPVEMTADPMFVINDVMGPQPARHDATLVWECNPSVLLEDAPRHIELQDGREIAVPAEWASADDQTAYEAWLDSDVIPKALIVEETSASGLPVVVVDHSEQEIPEDVPGTDPVPTDPTDPGDPTEPGDPTDPIAEPPAACGCSTSGGPGSTAALLALVGLARRRRVTGPPSSR